jgi:hypothetical protein
LSVASKDYPDPLAAWFRRNRLWLALALWVLLVLGGVEGLVSDGANGVVSFVYRAAFWGLLCWTWGSRANRNRPDFWVKWVAGWGALFVAGGALVVAAAVRGRFAPLTLVPCGFMALFLWQGIHSYRRTRRGLTWSRQPTNT